MISFPNAKINLGLNIVSKRDDGYHNIETIFYPIALKDALEIMPGSNKLPYNLFLSGLNIDCNPQDNLAVKALSLLRAERQIPNLDIHLLKAIPSGAGLGGGSSNGAFMLKLLNNTFSLGFTDAELHQFALKLGADCPFFLKNQPSFATGIGDKLENVDVSLDDFYLVVVKPDIFVSTKDAYANVVPKQPSLSLKEIVRKPIEEWHTYMHNDFESSVFYKYPSLAKIKQKLYDSGAVYASMSGSGTSLYGVFREKPKLIFPDYFVWNNYS